MQTLYRSIVKWYNDGLQNHSWGFNSFYFCKKMVYWFNVLGYQIVSLVVGVRFSYRPQIVLQELLINWLANSWCLSSERYTYCNEFM